MYIVKTLEFSIRIYKTIRTRLSGVLLGIIVCALLYPVVACRDQTTESSKPDATFIHLIERFSETGGYFDTDNLISNETSYLHVVGKLESLNLKGGAYIGVGPDQNFSYIARIRPEIAFMIDIRRDNLLQHLLFKALFDLAGNRLEYLCLLFDKTMPEDLSSWQSRSIRDLVRYIDNTPSVVPSRQEKILDRIRGFGVRISDQEQQSIREMHSAFIRTGLNLQFTTHNRTPMPDYPTYRDLLLEKSIEGNHGSYLAVEDDYQFLKSMQAQHRIIPVVGDLAGRHALMEIGDYLKKEEITVSAFYASNVEFYLMRQNQFDQFVRNVEQMPIGEDSVIIRSYFNRWANHPQSVPGYASTQLLQTIESLIAEYRNNGYRNYNDLITKHYLD